LAIALMVSFIHDTRQLSHFADDWRLDKISMLSTIFGNNHSRYFLQMWQYETLSESASITASVTIGIGNRLHNSTLYLVTYLKCPLGVLHHFVNFGCYFCLYEGKATYYTNIVSFILLFWRIRGR